jgi:ubiquinone/menaquinone biosynthesis C-methylase UbiE
VRQPWSIAVISALCAAGALLSAQAPESAITPTARQLNERWAADGRRSVSGFESPDRALFNKRHDVVDRLALKSGMAVADVGAGSGFYAKLIARRVGPGGSVFAVDISPGLVTHIAESAKAEGLDNVHAILGDPRSPKLADRSVDLVLVADTYHHFEFPREMLAGIKQALRPKGTFVVIDFDRIEGTSHPFILRDVRASRAVFVKEITSAGFTLTHEALVFEDEYMLTFVHTAPLVAAGTERH